MRSLAPSGRVELSVLVGREGDRTGPGVAPVNLKRAILLEYRRVYDGTPDLPYLHARDLPGRLGVDYETLAAHVQELEQGRFLHWKAQDLYKLSPRGVRVTGDAAELDREFPDA
jgi:hypothetical protein